MPSLYFAFKMQQVIRFVISAISVIKFNLVMHLQFQLQLPLAGFAIVLFAIAVCCLLFVVWSIVFVTNGCAGVWWSIVAVVRPQ